jgi:hypothetical protein
MGNVRSFKTETFKVQEIGYLDYKINYIDCEGQSEQEREKQTK